MDDYRGTGNPEMMTGLAAEHKPRISSREWSTNDHTHTANAGWMIRDCLSQHRTIEQWLHDSLWWSWLNSLQWCHALGCLVQWLWVRCSCREAVTYYVLHYLDNWGAVNKPSLTLSAHAPHSYSSWVCWCVCPVQFFQMETNRPGSPTDCLSAVISWFKTRSFL